MKWLFDNFTVVFGLVIILFMVVFSSIEFFKKPKKEQIESVKSWLLYAVAKAEKAFGGGTGALKLRHVYDLFVTKFPYIAPYISFDTFSDWVDDALIWLANQMKDNKNVKEYIEEK